MIQQNARPMYDQRKWLLGKIHDVAKRLGMSDPVRRDFMMAMVGENSCRDMSHQQLKKVLYALTHRSGTELRQAASAAHAAKSMTPLGSLVEGAMGKMYKLRSGRDERLPDEPVTIEQKMMIEQYAADVELLKPMERGWLGGVTKRACGKPHLKNYFPQTRAEGNKVIEALKSMRDREQKHLRAAQ